jgi:hypothetical protein
VVGVLGVVGVDGDGLGAGNGAGFVACQ